MNDQRFTSRSRCRSSGAPRSPGSDCFHRGRLRNGSPPPPPANAALRTVSLGCWRPLGEVEAGPPRPSRAIRVRMAHVLPPERTAGGSVTVVQPTVAAHQTGGAAGHGRVGHIHALHELALTEVAVLAFRTAWPNCSMPDTRSKRLHSRLSLASKSLRFSFHAPTLWLPTQGQRLKGSKATQSQHAKQPILK